MYSLCHNYLEFYSSKIHGSKQFTGSWLATQYPSAHSCFIFNRPARCCSIGHRRDSSSQATHFMSLAMTPSRLFRFWHGLFFAMFSIKVFLATLDRVLYFGCHHLFAFHLVDLTNQTIGQILGHFFSSLDRRILIDLNFNRFRSVLAPAAGRLFPLGSPLACLSCQRRISTVCTHLNVNENLSLQCQN